MIHILSTLSAGTEQNPLVASSGDSSTVSFMALFAQALKQGMAGDTSGHPVLSALPGHKGAKAAAAGNGQAAVAQPAGQLMTGKATVVDAKVVDAKVVDAKVVDAKVVDAKVVDAKVVDAKAVDSMTDEAKTGADASLMAMLGLPVPTPAVVDKTARSSASGTGSEPTDESAIDIKSGADGKKLPNPLAVIAGQQRKGLSQAQLAVARLEPGKADPLPSGVPVDAVKLSALSALPASTEVATPVVTTDTAAPPVSGQEASLVSVRSHAVAGPQGKMQINLQSGFGTPAWQQELGDKVVWMAGRHGQMAELVLNPPSLGAVEVRLNMNGSEATAQFFAANPHVRDVIEAALPRLRELMAEAGIAMGEAMVSDQSFGQRNKAEPGQGSGQGVLSGASSADDGQSIQAVRITGTSLLDYFA